MQPMHSPLRPARHLPHAQLGQHQRPTPARGRLLAHPQRSNGAVLRGNRALLLPQPLPVAPQLLVQHLHRGGCHRLGALEEQHWRMLSC